MYDDPQQRSRADTVFLMTAGGLGLLTLCLLAGLWLRADRRARLAEALLHETRQRDAEVARLTELLKTQPLFPAVDRKQLARQTVVLDGSEVSALGMPLDVAERIGLAGGDVVLVEPAPATAPATQPVP